MRNLSVFLLFLTASVAASGIAIAVPLTQEASVRPLIPLANWHKQFKITEGKDLGNVVPLTSQPDPSNERRWKLTFGNYAGMYLVQEATGAVVLERLDLLKSRNSIVYESPLLIVPSDIDSSNLLRRETGYKMFNIDSGKLKRTGRVTHLLQRPSASQFDTPAGQLDGYYIDIDHLMEMEYHSQLHLRLGLGYRLNEGPIYGSARYSVTKLGVFTATKSAGAALFSR
jgi:hypothetical protein